MKPLDQKVIAVLARMEYVNGFLTFHSEDAVLSRELYLAVKAVIELLGGKYNTRIKAFKMGYNPSETIETIVNTSLVPKKGTFEYFPTPKVVVEQMLEIAYLGENVEKLKFLEPSAGSGAIVEGLRSIGATYIDCVEIDPIHRETLRRKGFNVVSGDFADFQATTYYNGIVMNPPFKNYAEHLWKAWQLLDLDGVLTSIVPKGFKTSDKHTIKGFRELLYRYNGVVIDLPDNSFKDSGTAVQTCIISVQKGNIQYKTQPFEGFNTYLAYFVVYFILNHYPLYLRLKQLCTEGLTLDTCKGLILESCELYLREYNSPYEFTADQLTEDIYKEVFEYFCENQSEYKS